MEFQIRKSKDKQYYSVLVADNGQDLLTSETYTTKAMCKKTIRLILIALAKNYIEINDLTK